MTIAQIEKRRRKLERKYEQLFAHAIHAQVQPVFSELSREKNIFTLELNVASLIDNSKMREVLKHLYVECVEVFGMATRAEVLKMERKFLFFDNDFWSKVINNYLLGEAATKVTGLSATTERWIRSEIRASISEGYEQGLGIEPMAENLQARLKNDFPQMTKHRARTIARTEVVEASNYGSIEMARTITTIPLDKTWIFANDTRTRSSHRDIKRVGMNEKFYLPPITNASGAIVVEDAYVDYPGEPTAPAGQKINCRCAVAFIRSDE